MFFRKIEPRASHKNPDGSDGPDVPELATIGRNVTIDQFAVVLPGAIIPDNTVVLRGTVYTASGPVSFSAEDFAN